MTRSSPATPTVTASNGRGGLLAMLGLREAA